MDPQPPTDCPQCGAPLAANAVLCVNCGYHLKLGLQLATLADSDEESDVDGSAVNDNPYASPQTADFGTRRGRKAVFDLTEEGARRAEKVASAGEAVTAFGLFAFCLCPFVWFLMLPWSAYRLFSWYQLAGVYEELQYPNSLSPRADVAVRFHEARHRLLIGLIISAFFSLVFGVSFLARMLR